MNKLYFNNKYNKDILIGESDDEKEIMKLIYNFLQKKNYISHYIRSWEDDKFTWFDVGSHNEFFKWEG